MVMKLFKKQNRYSFKQVQQKCARMGVSVSETEFNKSPTKYISISNSYDKRFAKFLSDNKDLEISLHESISQSNHLPKHLINKKVRYILEKKFQNSLKSHTTQPKQQAQSPQATFSKETPQKTISPNVISYFGISLFEESKQTQIPSNSISISIPTNPPTNTTLSTKSRIEEKRRRYLLKRQQEALLARKRKIQNALKCAAISLPILGVGSAFYLNASNKETSSSENQKHSINIKNIPSNNIIVTDTKDVKPFNKDNVTIINDEYQETPVIASKFQQIDNNIPILKQDIIAQSPNIDLFNYCFTKATNYNNTNNNYGISSNMYNDFINNNNALAKYHKINSYKNLTYNNARIIAKAQIYDKYGIAHIQNQSLGTYIYNILHYTNRSNKSTRIIAQSIKDFYANHNKNMPYAQKVSLNNIINGSRYNSNDWYNLIASINATSVNPEYEGKLFALIQNRTINSDIIKNNTYLSNQSNFCYEPTVSDISMPLSSDVNSFMPTLQDLEYDYKKYAQILEKQKDAELNTFFNIYMQCSYDNYINLKYGYNKNEYFNRANIALRGHGIKTSIHRRLYCAGMSMASLCQASDIFKKENPESHINQAIDKLLLSCQNVHYCASLKTDLSRSTNSVYRSYDLENDVKKYMKKNKNAILFVWAPRGGGNFHHQTLFPASQASQNDAYTYCAFNRQHWGDENTFARYMRSRSRHGQGGFFADIEQGLDLLATQSLNKSINQTYAMAKKERKSNSDKSYTNLFAMNTLQR